MSKRWTSIHLPCSKLKHSQELRPDDRQGGMDVSQYYITTLTNAAKNLGPIVIFVIGGYFIFVKLPFLFLKKNLTDQKKKLFSQDQLPDATKKPYTVDDYKDFQRRIKILGPPPKQEQKKEVPKKEKISSLSAEALFEFSPGQKITQDQLKKKYLQLLKQNHPDKVASLGEDFKILAEKKTKEINAAYEKLKSRAA